MATTTPTLTEFLLARISEDEAWLAEESGWLEWCQECAFGLQPESPYSVSRMTAECEAKRRIVEREPSECGGHRDQVEFDSHHYPDPDWAFCDGCAAAASADSDWRWTLGVFASAYAAHPDYRDEWRP